MRKFKLSQKNLKNNYKMKGALWHPSSSTLLPIPTVFPISDISLQSLSNKKGIITSLSNEVWEMDVVSLEIHRISVGVSVNFVCCTDFVSMLIGDGSVFVYGEDPLHSGVLGIPSYKQETPLKIEINSYVLTGSLYNHAAVVDNNGKIFVWGASESGQTGTNPGKIDNYKPKIIENGNLFRAKEVVCGEKFTGVLTDGCYVYVYGIIGDAHRNSVKNSKVLNPKNKFGPSSHPELERMTAIEIAAGSDFLCVLVEGGEVFAYDNCMDLVKLPLPQGVGIQKIASCKDMAYGYGEGEVIEWSQGPRKSENNSCFLTTWNGRYYKLEKPYSQKTQIYSSKGKVFSMTFHAGKTIGAMPLGIKAFLINPYKRSEYVSKLIDNAFDSISPSSSPRSSISRFSNDSNSFSDLSRLYSIGNNENTIRKIIKYRKEHELTKAIFNALSPIVLEMFTFSFKSIKDQASMKKNYEKTLAAALILTPLEKIIQKNILTKYMIAFREVKCFSDCKEQVLKKEIEKKIEGMHKKEEFIRGMIHIINEALIKKIFHGFSMIKELEMRVLQKKTAVLSIGQIMNNRNLINKKNIFTIMKKFISKMNVLVKLIQKFEKNSKKAAVERFKTNSKFKLQRKNTLTKTIKDVIKKLQNHEIKYCFVKWKKIVDMIKVKIIRKKYCNQIGLKSIVLILGYSYCRTLRSSFESIKSGLKLNNIKKKASKLFTLLHKIVKQSKVLLFSEMKKLYTNEKALSKIFKVLKKLRKTSLRTNFRNIERFTISIYKSKTVKFFVTLQHVIEKSNAKNMRSVWTFLSCISKSVDDPILNPSYSFYSPKLKIAKTGIIRTKNYSSLIADIDHEDPQSFNFEQGVQRLKKMNTIGSSFSGISTARDLTLSSLHSSKESLLRKDSIELQSFKKSLINKKISEASLKSKNAKVNVSGKPPLKPPWKPASASMVVSNKKLPINSTVRRSQYANTLKERVKSHSKTASADISNYASTPNLSSRNSSRQKLTRVSFANLDCFLPNFKFGATILENFVTAIKRKRLFEAIYRLKYVKNYSPKLPAPNPLDSHFGKKTVLSWQGNLYKIGFEKLKNIAKHATGREILKKIKNF